jgi:hypothetical protein
MHLPAAGRECGMQYPESVEMRQGFSKERDITKFRRLLKNYFLCHPSERSEGSQLLEEQDSSLHSE